MGEIMDGIREEQEPAESIVCQFCGETDFDGYGLKLHLTHGWCRVFEAISPDSPSISAFQALENSKAALADAVEDEREACAQLVSAMEAEGWVKTKWQDWQLLEPVAAAIRARATTEKGDRHDG